MHTILEVTLSDSMYNAFSEGLFSILNQYRYTYTRKLMCALMLCGSSTFYSILVRVAIYKQYFELKTGRAAAPTRTTCCL